MTISKNKYIDEEKPRFNDCVEGDTVSEGDTSDEEDNQVSKNNREIPSGNADCSCHTRGRKRRSLYSVIAIAAVVVTGAAIGGGVYATRKNWGSSSPSIVIDDEFALSSPIPATPKTSASEEDNTDYTQTNENTTTTSLSEENDNITTIDDADTTPSTTEDESDNISIEEDATNENDSNLSAEVEEEPQPTNWPSLVGMTGENAKAQLELLYGEGTYDIYILHEHSLTTRDYRFNRIRIFTNDNGVVTRVPRIG